MIIREIVASALGILTGLACLLFVLRRYQSFLLSRHKNRPLHRLGFFYASFAIFFVPTLLVTWAISNQGMAAVVIGSVGVPILLMFKGLDALIYESRAASGIRRWWHWLSGLTCLLITFYLLALYLRYILVHWQ